MKKCANQKGSRTLPKQCLQLRPYLYIWRGMYILYRYTAIIRKSARIDSLLFPHGIYTARRAGVRVRVGARYDYKNARAFAVHMPGSLTVIAVLSLPCFKRCAHVHYPKSIITRHIDVNIFIAIYLRL